MTASAQTAPQVTASPTTGINAFRPRILHTAYFVAGIERSLKFYRDVLGMKELQRFDLGEGVHEVVMNFPESKGGGVILMWNLNRKSDYVRGDGYSRFVMSVSDLDAAIKHLTQHGVQFSKGRTEVGGMAYCMAKDPDGYVIELLQFSRPAKV
jgi:lactoylglutathione lyase